MRAPPGIMLNPLNVVFPRPKAMEIHDSDSTLVPSTAVADGDVPGKVAATAGLALFGEGELEDRAAFVKVVVYRADEMADSWSSGLVAAEGGLAGHGGVAHWGWFDV